MSPLLARSGHVEISSRCPLSGRSGRDVLVLSLSAFDPQETLGAGAKALALRAVSWAPPPRQPEAVVVICRCKGAGRGGGGFLSPFRAAVAAPNLDCKKIPAERANGRIAEGNARHTIDTAAAPGRSGTACICADICNFTCRCAAV